MQRRMASPCTCMYTSTKGNRPLDQISESTILEDVETTRYASSTPLTVKYEGGYRVYLIIGVSPYVGRGVLSPRSFV